MINKTLSNKTKKSDNPKDKVFLQCIKNRMKEIVSYILMKKKRKVTQPMCMSFVEQRKNTDLFSSLYSFKWPFELLHADIKDIKFVAKSAVSLKYCLLFVNLLTSKLYPYGIKDRSLLAKKIILFSMKLLKKEIEYLIQTDRYREILKVKRLTWIRSITYICLVQKFRHK